jgi:Fe-S-cluster containining protein
MPAGSAGALAILDSYRDLLERMDAAARAASRADSPGPCGGCHACCGPVSLLPLEAHALLATGLLDDRPPAAAVCPLLDPTGCRAASARPFACRTRGLPVRHLDAEGTWETAVCGFIGRDGRGRDAGVPLAEWASVLFHLDREFRECLGLPPARIDLADLCRAPGRYRALLSVPAALPLASRTEP